MIKHKSTLAKLLAKENITVQYGNYKTAWFDIKNRILGIPLWKDMGKDVADLFIGHEVGHALFTPYEGWHDSPEKLEGCPRSYINVVEDARIERHIKEAYVGLVAPMAKGYRQLFEDDFFGVDEDLDWDQVKLIDKINLKAKVGAHLDVPMSDEELVFYNRSMKTETFDEVLDLVRDILAYTKENQEELMTPPPMGSQSETEGQEEEDDMSPTGHDDMESQDEQTKDTGNEQQDPIDETDEEGNDSAKGDPSKADDDGDNQGNVEDQKPSEEDVSETDEAFRRKEHTLLDINENGSQTLIGNEFSKPVRDAIITPYAQLKKSRQAKLEQYDSQNDHTLAEHKEEFKQYLKTVKQNVNFAVKEFEMRKAAFRYTRAQTAKTGSVDVNRLWSYKTNDDIFARVTKLADAKNHGMMMLIDYSGSMSECMTNVMDQLLHLVVFCKAVNIPFDVYGFTNSNPRLSQWLYDEEDGIRDMSIAQIESEVHHGGLSLPQVIASTLKKADYEEALFHIYLRKVLAKREYGFYERYVLAPEEEYGSTPLNQSLIAAHRMVNNFKRNNNIDNMNFVVISDGDTNGISIVKNRERDYTLTESYKGAIVNIMGEHIKLEDTRKKGTQSLLENLQKKFGCTTIGFFLADNAHNFKYKIEDCDEDCYYDSSNMRKYQKEYNKKKCVTFKDALGYNEFYVLKSKRLETDAEEFVTAEDASKGQLTTAFKKFSKSKKLNKTLLTNFGKAVAE
jgi:hypothetical protein